MKTLAIYLRTARKDSNAIAQQKAKILDALKTLPMTWTPSRIETFEDDGYSGLTTDRPGYRAMMQMIEDRVIDALAMTDLTRIGRSSALIYGFIDQLKRNGILLISLSQDYVAPRTQVADQCKTVG